MEHALINIVSAKLIKGIADLSVSEARSFNINIAVGNHKYTAEYFHGTFEKDGSYDILPGIRVCIDDAPYGLGEKCHVNVACRIDAIVAKSDEYKRLQDIFDERLEKLERFMHGDKF